MEEIIQDNIANYYMLSLLRLDKTSFGKNNFVNTYVTKDKEIVVEVLTEDLIPEIIFKHEDYQTDFVDSTEEENRVIILFSVPKKFEKEYELFMAGKYSQFSDEAKKLIIQYSVNSGLKYRVPEDPKDKSNRRFITDRRLRALTKDEVLRKNIEESIGMPLPADAELFDIPGEDNYYSYRD